MVNPSQPIILLAEDEQCIRDLLCHILGQQGFIVLPAKDGREAVEIADAAHIDLLVTDLDMPHMSGVTLAKRMRPHLPVLLISGHPDGTAVLQPGWQFLEKPFRPNAIVTKIQELLGAATAAKQ